VVVWGLYQREAVGLASTSGALTAPVGGFLPDVRFSGAFMENAPGGE
jgi:hypothetical protein